MNRGNKIQSGATLLEVLIVVAIILIMSGLSFVSYRDVQVSDELRDVAEQIKNIILETQALALGPRNTGSPTLPIEAYRVDVDVASPPTIKANLKVFEVYTDNSNDELHGRGLSLPKYFTIARQNFVDSISFSVEQHGRITTPLLNELGPICLAVYSDRASRTKAINITKSTVKVTISDGPC